MPDFFSQFIEIIQIFTHFHSNIRCYSMILLLILQLVATSGKNSHSPHIFFPSYVILSNWREFFSGGISHVLRLTKGQTYEQRRRLQKQVFAFFVSLLQYKQCLQFILWHYLCSRMLPLCYPISDLKLRYYTCILLILLNPHLLWFSRFWIWIWNDQKFEQRLKVISWPRILRRKWSIGWSNGQITPPPLSKKKKCDEIAFLVGTVCNVYGMFVILEVWPAFKQAEMRQALLCNFQNQ